MLVYFAHSRTLSTTSLFVELKTFILRIARAINSFNVYCCPLLRRRKTERNFCLVLVGTKVIDAELASKSARNFPPLR